MNATSYLLPITAFCASVAIGAPHIFYTDLDSGPNTGGEKNAGAFVTIYGKGFGAAQGTSFVSVGGGRASAYPVWSDTKVAFQLGSAAVSGDIVIETAGVSSNPIHFEVRPGKIFFVANDGKDGNSGSFTSPWRTISKAVDTIKPGDIIYVRNGVTASKEDGNGWRSCLTLGANAGTQGHPKALVVFPGESATIGSEKALASEGCELGIRAKGQGESYWTIAGFNLRGGGIAINPYGEAGWRIIGNDMSCPNGNGQAGCMDIANGGPYYIYGNTIHHVGTNLNPSTVTALYHGVYLSDAVHNVDFGWNTIAWVQGCRGLQQNANGDAKNAYAISIHDNVIHDTQCDGIVMTTVDPSRGPVELYNNIIYNAGKGPNNTEHTGAWSCMNIQGYDVGGTPGSGAVDVYHNTMFNCGTFANPPYKDSSAGLLWVSGGNQNKYARIRDNIFYMPSGVPYLVIYGAKGICSDCNNVRGSNNLFYGNGRPPSNSNITGSIAQDPSFRNSSHQDFHLAATSPARRAGVNTGSSFDPDGNKRAPSPGVDVGAFQHNDNH